MSLPQAHPTPLDACIFGINTKRGELLRYFLRTCVREIQNQVNPKQRSGMGGGRGSDIRREATAEQSGNRSAVSMRPTFRPTAQKTAAASKRPCSF
jgi:hypothetical protein